MRSRVLVAFTLLLSVCVAVRSQRDSGYFEQQERMAQLHVTGLVEPWLEANRVPGAVVALVQRDRTLFRGGFGLADTNRGIAATPGASIVSAGNLVRALTATAVLQLVERGDLDLGSDVAQMIPLESLARGSFGPLTVNDLLLDVAGLDQRLIATRSRTADDLTDLTEYLESRLPARVRPPGVISVASAQGYSLLGNLVERTSGETLDRYLERSVLSPLEMSSTWIDPRRSSRGRVAIGYRRKEGQLNAITADLPRALGASSLWTTADDMSRWMKMVLSDGSLEGHVVLTSLSVEALLEQRFTPHESLSGRTIAFQRGRGLPSNELILESTGSGFAAAMMLLPRQRVGLFVAINLELDLRHLMLQILQPFDPSAAQQPDDPRSSQVLDVGEWTGVWRDASVSLATAEKLVSLVRQDTIRAAPDGALLWRSRLFEPVAPPCYQERDTPLRLCLVEGSNRARFAIIDDLVLEKIPWYDSRPVQVTLWIAFATFFLAAGWPRSPLPKRQVSLDPDDAFPPRWPISLARLAAALHFVFIASLAIAVALQLRAGVSTLLYEIPLHALCILTLPLLAAGFTLAAATGALAFWRSPRASGGHRLRFLGLLTPLLAFLPFLWSWNLLGFLL